jgi:hypothetical protein
VKEQNQIMTKKVDHIGTSEVVSSSITNKPPLDEATRLYKKIEKCIKQILPVIGSHSIWKKSFPKDAQEIIFEKTPQCSFTPFQYILQPILSREITLSEIKNILSGGYMKLQESHQKRILVVLANQGKKDMMKHVKKIEDLEILIQTEDYYMTDLDAWILAREYSIPMILFSSTTLKNMVASKWFFIGSSSLYSPLFFLRSPPNTASNESPQYSIIATPYKFTELKKELSTIIQTAIDDSDKMNIQTLEEFLDGIEIL